MTLERCPGCGTVPEIVPLLDGTTVITCRVCLQYYIAADGTLESVAIAWNRASRPRPGVNLYRAVGPEALWNDGIRRELCE